MQRGDIWWADLGLVKGSGPSKRRRVLVVQSDPFNDSAICTVMVAVVTSNLRLAGAPGNVIVAPKLSQLKNDSVVNVSQVITIDKSSLTEQSGAVDGRTMRKVEEGLRLSLGL